MRGQKRTAWGLVVILTLAGMTIALVRERSTSRQAQRSWEVYKDQLTRIRSIDELTGRTLPPLELRGVDGTMTNLATAGAQAPVWVLDVGDCSSCLDQIPRWNRAVDVSPSGPVLVLVGTPLDRARQLVTQLGIRFPVYISEEDTRVRLGLRMPSTYLFLGDEGVALLVDAHSTHTSCQWNFPVQAAALAAGTDLGACCD